MESTIMNEYFRNWKTRIMNRNKRQKSYNHSNTKKEQPVPLEKAALF